MLMPEEERRNAGLYHESGHALVARLLPKTDPVHKVTVIPRGRALGVTIQLPEGDRYSLDKDLDVEHDLPVLFGGRVYAEEVFMHQMTTGASNDFERATQMARRGHHGDALRHDRRTRPDGLCRERGRSSSAAR